QADRVDEFRNAEPGKILHELRVGELARAGEIPQSPAYYGTVDATLLFVILLAEYVRWSGDVALARGLAPNLDAAIRWATGVADHDGDGYLDYVGAYRGGLVNQGWKDSGDAIVNADGGLVRPPVATCEVQSYAYRAFGDAAWLYAILGRAQDAVGLRTRARRLRAAFERDFWSERLGCYVLALQRGGRPALVASSNAGQVLWGGIASHAHARRVARRRDGANAARRSGPAALAGLDRARGHPRGRRADRSARGAGACRRRPDAHANAQAGPTRGGCSAGGAVT